MDTGPNFAPPLSGIGKRSVTGDPVAGQGLSLNDAGRLPYGAFNTVMSDYPVAWKTASSPQPAIGNGILEGKFVQLGGLIFVSVYLLAGSSTTFGTSDWAFTLPTTDSEVAVTSQYIAPHSFISSGVARDSSANVVVPVTWMVGTSGNETDVSNAWRVYQTNSGGGGGASMTTLQASWAPFSWASGDKLILNLWYASLMFAGTTRGLT